jgi:hypothetical protein
MNTSLHHIVAQLRIEEMRHEAERARRQRSPETTRSPSASRRSLTRAWAQRHGMLPVPSPQTSRRVDGS